MEITGIVLISIYLSLLVITLLLIARLLGQQQRFHSKGLLRQNGRIFSTGKLVLEVGMATDRGKVRSRNEDHLGAVIPDGQGGARVVILP